MALFEGKTIILGAPTDYQFSDTIERELAYQGFKVINISFSPTKFKYKNIFERLKSFVHKNFLGQKDYKVYLKSKRIEGQILKALRQVSVADFALLIRPDQYSHLVLNKIRSKAIHMVGYQWDGLSRFPNVFNCMDYFDRFFVFDPKDMADDHLLPLTNFYTNSFSIPYDPTMESDAVYVGTYMRDRIAQVEEIIEALRGHGLQVKTHLYCGRKNKKVINGGLVTEERRLSYAENLHVSAHSKIIIDVNHGGHQGLSFRVFEALGFGRKLITTNQEIKRYDFYHPNNILVWGDHTDEELRAFLAAPVVSPLPHIKEKYSFSNWISYVLGYTSCQHIQLPSLEEAKLVC